MRLNYRRYMEKQTTTSGLPIQKVEPHPVDSAHNDDRVHLYFRHQVYRIHATLWFHARVSRRVMSVDAYNRVYVPCTRNPPQQHRGVRTEWLYHTVLNGKKAITYAGHEKALANDLYLCTNLVPVVGVFQSACKEHCKFERLEGS